MMEVVIVDDGNRLTVYELVERVIPCIIAKHYSENYIQGFRSTFRNLLAYCNKNEKKYFTAELAQQFMLDCYGVQPGTVERRCSRVHRAMDLLSDYQHFNAVMLRRRLNREFPAGLQEGAVNYLQKLSLHGRRENTLRSHRNVLLRFTDYLFSVGVTDYKSLSADIVNRYVKVVSCNYSNSVVRLHYSILLRFFQYLAHSGYKETDLSLKMVPIVKVSASARIPTTLDLSQIESILASVDRESPQGKRDYAVLMIAVKLGIRTSDIRNLRPANFNWEQHLVSFTQVKTGEPITLPLPTDVGWAVIDYLKNGRPVSDAPEIFLRAVAPYVSLQNFDNILIKHMRKAGIPLDSIKHHGLHSLRHSLATHMLDEGIPITSIQGVLGHINADSTQKYIGVNHNKKSVKISLNLFALYAVLVCGIVFALPAFAASDPLVVVENLSTFIFSLIRAVGLILLGWGIVQVGLSLQSHDPSQRSQGFLTLAGGLVITFAKEILDLITA